jgi:hypothetical protein
VNCEEQLFAAMFFVRSYAAMPREKVFPCMVRWDACR